MVGQTHPLAWLSFVVVFLVQASFVARFSINLPLWDDWENAILHHHTEQGALTFKELFSQHTDHRLLVARMAFIGIHGSIGEWDLRVEMLFSATVLGGTAGWLVYLLRRLGTPVAACILAWLPLVSPFQWENILWGFQIQFYLLVFLNLAVVITIALARSISSIVVWWLVGLCSASTFTMGSGMFVWVIAAVCLVVKFCASPPQHIRLSKETITLRAATCFLLAGVGCVALYLFDYKETFSNLKPVHFGTFVEWWVRALNYPLLESRSPWTVALALGQWIVIGLVMGVLALRRWTAVGRSLLVTLTGLVAFLVINAAVTGYRRSGYIEETPGVEILSRYATVFLWNTIIFLIAAATLVRFEHSRPAWQKWLARLGILVLAAGVVAVQADRFSKGMIVMNQLRVDRLAQAETVVNYLNDGRPTRRPDGPVPIFEHRLSALLDDKHVVAQIPPWLRSAGSSFPLTVADQEETRFESPSIELIKPVLVIPISDWNGSCNPRIQIVTDGNRAQVIAELRNAGQVQREWRVDVSHHIGHRIRIVVIAEDASAVVELKQPWQTGFIAGRLDAFLNWLNIPLEEAFHLEVTASAPEPQVMQLFYLKDGQTEYSPESSITIELLSKQFRTYRFLLKPGLYSGFRFDPMFGAGRADFRGARVVETQTGIVCYEFPVDRWQLGAGLQAMDSGGSMQVVAPVGHVDPTIFFELPSQGLVLGNKSARFSATIFLAFGTCALVLCTFALVRPGATLSA